MAAFRGMHMSPAKHSSAWLPRKCHYWTDRHTHRQTDRQTDWQSDARQSYPYVLLCFAGNTKRVYQWFDSCCLTWSCPPWFSCTGPCWYCRRYYSEASPRFQRPPSSGDSPGVKYHCISRLAPFWHLSENRGIKMSYHLFGVEICIFFIYTIYLKAVSASKF